MSYTLVQPENSLVPVELPRVEYDPTLTFLHTKVIDAFAYWNACRGLRPLPRRADLDPVAMRSFIAHVALFDVRRKGDGSVDYFVRLAGTRVEDVFGSRGRRMLTEGLAPEIVSRWRQPVDRVLETGRPLRTRSRVAFQNQTWIDGEALHAPLGESPTAPDMIFFAFGILSANPPLSPF